VWDFALIAFLLATATQGRPATSGGSRQDICRPTYMVLERPVEINVGASELRFSLLAVGCEKELAPAWPPELEKLQREFAAELSEPHPVQTLLLIRERAPDLRRRLTRRLNSVLGMPVAYDVFLYDARASE
jgi:hypothetical protein